MTEGASAVGAPVGPAAPGELGAAAGSAGSGGPSGPSVGAARAAWVIASLKWRLLRNGLSGSTHQRIQSWFALVCSAGAGLLAAALLAVLGRGADISSELIVVILPVSVGGVALLSAAAGVESSLDPRHLVQEPITRWGLGLGVLAAATVGPPALVALLSGLGVFLGWVRSPAEAIVIAVAIVAWWATLLLCSRALANALGVVAGGRFRHVAQFSATFAALLAWLSTQLVVRDTAGWDPERWAHMARMASWTPPGQLGRAVAAAASPGAAWVHLLAGVWWLPLLAWVSVRTTHRLAASAPRPGGGTRRAPAPAGVGQPMLRRLLPSSPAGVLARRTVRTKLRTPRQVVNTVTALCVGGGVFLLGPVLSDGPIDHRVVLLGGLLHVAVLFDGNNAFGLDGPAIWSEVAAGADAGVLVRAKVMSSLLVMALPAAVLPVAMAALSGGWRWLPAAWLIAAGSVAAAAGVAVASATFAPFAMPESPNPLAAGDTGQGCLAGVGLGVSITVLTVVSVPVAVGVLYASARSVSLTTAVAVSAPLVGVAAMLGFAKLAVRAMSGKEERLVERVTPAR